MLKLVSDEALTSQHGSYDNFVQNHIKQGE